MAHKKRRKLTAKQKKYFGKRKVKRNPNVAMSYRASHYRRSGKAKRRRARPATLTRTRFYGRRATGFLERYGFETVLPAGVGAAGALAIDLAWGYLPLPDTLKTGPLAPAVRLAAAVGVGVAAGAIGGKKFGRDVTAGATVVTLYDLIKGYLKTNFTALPLDGVGWYNPGTNIGPLRSSARLGMRVGEYTPDYVYAENQDSGGCEQLGMYVG